MNKKLNRKRTQFHLSHEVADMLDRLREGSKSNFINDAIRDALCNDIELEPTKRVSNGKCVMVYFDNDLNAELSKLGKNKKSKYVNQILLTKTIPTMKAHAKFNEDGTVDVTFNTSDTIQKNSTSTRTFSGIDHALKFVRENNLECTM